MRLPRRVGEQRLLRHAGLVPQRLQLPGVDAVSFPFEPLLHDVRQRQVHVVAAEQDVIADRDALEREVAVALADRDQREVGGAAADVAHQHDVADAQLPAPAVARAVDPRVEGGLRLLEQRDVREAGGVRRLQRQLARHRVERRRHGEEDVLAFERERRVGGREARVPRPSQMPEVGATRRRPAASANASAQLVVPRSIPMLKRVSPGIGSRPFDFGLRDGGAIALRHFDFGLSDDGAGGGVAERWQLDARDPPPAVQQASGEWRPSGHIAHEADGGRIEVLNDRDRFPFPAVEDRLEGDVAFEHAAAASVDVAHGGADLRVLVRRHILHEEIDEAAIALQQREHLHGAIVAVFSHGDGRRRTRCSWLLRRRLQLRRKPSLEKNREPCRKRELDPNPHAVDRLFHALILT